MKIKDPNEIVARLYPTSTVAAGAGMPLTIRQPDGTNAVYDGSNAVTADARPKTLTITNSDGTTTTYNGSANKTVTIPSTLPPTPGSVDFGSLDLSFAADVAALQTQDGYLKEMVVKSQIINIKRFWDADGYIRGAKGDGATDDGWMIQHAIDRAHATGQDVVVYFPEGIYNITRTLFYYSNMTFVFAPGAVVRCSTSDDTTRPTVLFSSYYDPAMAVYTGGSPTGIDGNRFAVENVTFIGGEMSGYCYNHTDSSLSLTSIVFLVAFAKNVKILGMRFPENSGGHSVEVNASTNVVIRDCLFAGYHSTVAYSHEQLQFDAATPNATASQMIVTKHTGDLTTPSGLHVSTWYTYTRDDKLNYRMTGGYYDFTFVPPGNRYTRTENNVTTDSNQPEMNIKLIGSDNRSVVITKHPFRQCCHGITVDRCEFRNDEGTACHVTAVGAHTDFRTPSQDNYGNQNEDVHTWITITNNTFYWPMNRSTGADGAATDAARGVIAFGFRTGDTLVNSHVNSAVIANNTFYGLGDASEYAITAVRSGKRRTRRCDDFPAEKYAVANNQYYNILGWERPQKENIAQADYILTNAETIKSFRVYTYEDRVAGHINFGPVVFPSTKYLAAATINVDLRPYASTSIWGVDGQGNPIVTDSVNVECPLAGFAYGSDNVRYTINGYISTGYSTATITLICEEAAIGKTLTNCVISFEYPL